MASELAVQAPSAEPQQRRRPSATERLEQLSAGPIARLHRRGDLAACLPALLVALDWRGAPRLLAELLPAGDGPIDLTDLTSTLRRLGLASRLSATPPSELGDAQLPCLVLPPSAPAYLVLATHGREIEIHRPGSDTTERLRRERLRGRVLMVGSADPDGTAAEPVPGESWLAQQLRPYRRIVLAAAGLTLLMNLLALATSLYVTAVYDRVIAAFEPATILPLLLGAAAALGIELWVRSLRSRLLSRSGARLAFTVGNAVLAKLLALPAQLTERASLASQLARIRDLERVRELLTGSIAQLYFDVPFALVFLVALSFIGGWLALVPSLAVALLLGFSLLATGPIERTVRQAGKAAGERQELVLEVVEKMRAIRMSGGTASWLERYEVLADRALATGARSAAAAAAVQAVSHSATLLAGLATVAVGIALVLDGALSTGALIGSTILTWRVLTPVQGAVVALSRLRQIAASARQVDSFMAIAPERPPGTIAAPLARVEGRVAFTRVTFRYGRETEPVLGNITFTAEPGELVAIIGRNGVGKSTLMKLATGLYHPQVGNIRIDDRDLRQYDPVELRHAIGYVPQYPKMFTGTVAANLRLVAPLAEDGELDEALERAGVADEVRRLPDGLATMLDARRMQQLPTSLMVRLSLARAFARRSRILLLDDPAASLDRASEQTFLEALDGLRGTATVLMTTHRPSHVKRADKLLILVGGAMRYFGPVSGVTDKVILESI